MARHMVTLPLFMSLNLASANEYVLGQERESCTLACDAAGLHCSVVSLGNGSIDSDDKLAAAVQAAGMKCSSTTGLPFFTELMPFMNADACFFSTGEFVAGNINCDAIPELSMRRLCHCEDSVPTSTASSTSTQTYTTTSASAMCGVTSTGPYDVVGVLSPINVSSVQECCDLCAADSNCMYVSYGAYTAGHSWACFQHTAPRSAALRLDGAHNCPGFLKGCVHARVRSDPHLNRGTASIIAFFVVVLLVSLFLILLVRGRKMSPTAAECLISEDTATWVSFQKEFKEQKIGMGITGNKVTSLQSGGAVERWNCENPDKTILPGAVILEVNGQCDRHRLREEIKRAEGRLVLRVILEPTELPRLEHSTMIRTWS